MNLTTLILNRYLSFMVKFSFYEIKEWLFLIHFNSFEDPVSDRGLQSFLSHRPLFNLWKKIHIMLYHIKTDDLIGQLETTANEHLTKTSGLINKN